MHGIFKVFMQPKRLEMRKTKSRLKDNEDKKILDLIADGNTKSFLDCRICKLLI